MGSGPVDDLEEKKMGSRQPRRVKMNRPDEKEGGPPEDAPARRLLAANYDASN